MKVLKINCGVIEGDSIAKKGGQHGLPIRAASGKVCSPEVGLRWGSLGVVFIFRRPGRVQGLGRPVFRVSWQVFRVSWQAFRVNWQAFRVNWQGVAFVCLIFRIDSGTDSPLPDWNVAE